MEMFSEVEWKKSNATTQELVCKCRSESVLRSVNWNMVDSASGRMRRRLQDEISRIQKVTMVEIVFRGAPGCFRGT